MMAKEPANRYQTPVEVAAALAPFTGQGVVRPRRRWPLVVAAAVLFAGLTAAAVAVYRVETDKGQLVITTESDDVEVVIKQNGKEVRIIDTKTDKSITLWSGEYELELKDAGEGLKLNIDRATLTRGETVLAKIERVKPTADEEKVGEVRRFEGHTGSVRGVAYSPGGRYALSVGGWPHPDRTLRLWDLATGKEVWNKLADPSDAICVAFSPDGRRAVSGGGSGDLRLWEVETGKELRVWTHGGSVLAVAFMPDGKHVLSGGDSGWLRLWDVDTGKQVKEFEDREDPITGIAVSPDGGRAVSGAHLSLVHLWDLQAGKELRRFEATGSAVAFGPDGRYVLSGGKDTKVLLWDTETGKEIRQLLGNTRNLDSVTFSPDGQRALSGGTDGTIRLWDLATGKELHRFEKFQAPGIVPGILEPISCVRAAFSPDGHYAFSGGMDGICRLWRLPDPTPPEKVGEVRRFLGYVPSGVGDERPIHPERPPRRGHQWLDARLGCGERGGGMANHRSHSVGLGLALAPDSKTAYESTDDGVVHVFDLEKAKEVGRLDAPGRGPSEVQLSADGKRLLIVVLHVWKVRLCEVPGGKELAQLQGNGPAALSPDGAGSPCAGISGSYCGTSPLARRRADSRSTWKGAAGRIPFHAGRAVPGDGGVGY